jgi:RimJ/RimL family protein N-acetyltransferase
LQKHLTNEGQGHEGCSPQIQLREVEEEDLPIFFEQQLNPEANHMAAFTRKDPSDKEAFETHWMKILADETIPIKTILFDGQVAGSILSYEQSGERQVSYWLGREYWGKGIATLALSLYLEDINQRPLYARAAKDNIGSIRVLEKCGFIISGYDRGFANARGAMIDEVIMMLR